MVGAVLSGSSAVAARAVGLLAVLVCLFGTLGARAAAAPAPPKASPSTGASTAFFYGDRIPRELFAQYDREEGRARAGMRSP